MINGHNKAPFVRFDGFTMRVHCYLLYERFERIQTKTYHFSDCSGNSILTQHKKKCQIYVNYTGRQDNAVFVHGAIKVLYLYCRFGEVNRGTLSKVHNLICLVLCILFLVAYKIAE